MNNLSRRKKKHDCRPSAFFWQKQHKQFHSIQHGDHTSDMGHVRSYSGLSAGKLFLLLPFVFCGWSVWLMCVYYDRQGLSGIPINSVNITCIWRRSCGMTCSTCCETTHLKNLEETLLSRVCFFVRPTLKARHQFGNPEDDASLLSLRR